MEELYYTYYQSPIGLIKIGGTEHYIAELAFVDKPEQVKHGEPGVSEVMHQCTEQLIEFFSGKRRAFDNSCSSARNILPAKSMGRVIANTLWQNHFLS
jgi:O6-methylguanine-DNA--protein-cysteine methyltransferase